MIVPGIGPRIAQRMAQLGTSKEPPVDAAPTSAPEPEPTPAPAPAPEAPQEEVSIDEQLRVLGAQAESPDVDPREAEALRNIGAGAQAMGEAPVVSESETVEETPFVGPEQDTVDREPGMTVKTASRGVFPEYFGSFVAKGESAGSYDAMNRGKDPATGKILDPSTDTETTSELLGKPLTEMTIQEVMDLQKQEKVFAAGRYQIIPDTMEFLMNSGFPGMPAPSEKFDARVQDRLLFSLLTQKRPAVGDYIRGVSDDLAGAVQAFALEFASMPKVDGESAYPGENVGHSVSDVVQMLNRARSEMAGTLIPTTQSRPGLVQGPRGEARLPYEQMTPTERIEYGMRTRGRRPTYKTVPTGMSSAIPEEKLKNILFRSYTAPLDDVFPDPGAGDTEMRTERVPTIGGEQREAPAEETETTAKSESGLSDDIKADIEEIANAAEGTELEARLAKLKASEETDADWTDFLNDRVVVNLLTSARNFKNSPQRLQDLANFLKAQDTRITNPARMLPGPQQRLLTGPVAEFVETFSTDAAPVMTKAQAQAVDKAGKAARTIDKIFAEMETPDRFAPKTRPSRVFEVSPGRVTGTGTQLGMFDDVPIKINVREDKAAAKAYEANQKLIMRNMQRLARIDRLEGKVDQQALAAYRYYVAKGLLEEGMSAADIPAGSVDFRTNFQKFAANVKQSPRVVANAMRAIAQYGPRQIASSLATSTRALAASPNKWRIFAQTFGPKSLAMTLRSNVAISAAYELARATNEEALNIQKQMFGGSPVELLRGMARSTGRTFSEQDLLEDIEKGVVRFGIGPRDRSVPVSPEGQELLADKEVGGRAGQVYLGLINELASMPPDEAYDLIAELVSEPVTRGTDAGKPAITKEFGEELFSTMMDLNTNKMDGATNRVDSRARFRQMSEAAAATAMKNN